MNITLRISFTVLAAILLQLPCLPMDQAMAQPKAETPDWAKGAVWYQIFPERFRNGDPENDPTAERVGGPEGWSVSDWTGDWYARNDWEQDMGPQFRDLVFTRRYGGDLQGVIDKLGYLQNLGVTAIYFNPIFDAVTLHKYDASVYHHVDRFFGPKPQADAEMMEQEDPGNPETWQWTSADSLFLTLIEEAHKRDIKIVLDGVFNHTGQDFWAFRELKEKQQSAATSEWYDVISYDDPETDENEFDFHGWWGYKGLPEFKELNGNLVEPVKQHIFDISKRWMDPNGDGDPSDGIDGWRLDVAEEVGHPFWKEWHAYIRSINPEVYTTAEIWSRKATEFIAEDEFMASMNYPFLRAVHLFFIKQDYSATQLDTALANIRNLYDRETNLVMQNLMESHDTERLGTMIVNSDHDFKEGSKIEDISNDYDVRKPTAEEYEVQKLVALFQYTYLGSPMVYYGTEAGIWGADDPDDRKPMLWSEFTYDDEINHPFSRRRPRDSNGVNADLLAWYGSIGKLHAERKELKTGNFTTLATDDSTQSIAYLRYQGKEMTLVAINRSGEEATLSISKPEEVRRFSRTWKDAFSGEEFRPSKRNRFTLSVPPMSATVLIN